MPLEIDLEDRLIYGLSPQRFGYLVLGGLAAMALWSQAWLPEAIRVGLSVVPLGAGAGLAWGGWRGRGLDLLIWDAALYLVRNYQLQRTRRPPPPAVPPAERVPLAPLNTVGSCTAPGLDPAPWFG